MNLTKLFETQKVLDERIVQEKGLEGQDLLPQKILALQVELGELANEWRGFKFWSEDREPRTNAAVKCEKCDGLGIIRGDYGFTLCDKCNEGVKSMSNPLLEEYVDCLHFILSVGLEYGCEDVRPAIRKTVVNFKGDELTAQFNEIMYRVGNQPFAASKNVEYQILLGCFLGLGEMLGFTWEQVSDAYMLKNKINHERQATGY